MLSKINSTSVLLGFVIILVVIIQANLLPYFDIDQAVLNIVLILITLLIFQKKNLLALYVAIFAGIILDINFGIGFGPYLLSYLIVFGFIYFLQNMVLREETIVFYIILVLFATLIFDMVLIAVINIVGYNISLIQFWQVILKEAGYNVAVSVIIFGLYNYYLIKYLPSSEIKLSERL